MIRLSLKQSDGHDALRTGLVSARDFCSRITTWQNAGLAGSLFCGLIEITLNASQNIRLPTCCVYSVFSTCSVSLHHKQGYNGSQLWDTAFHVMAVLETERVYPSANGLEFSETLGKAYHYIDITQGEEDVPQRQRFYRHISKGGWPFSTKDHGTFVRSFFNDY